MKIFRYLMFLIVCTFDSKNQMMSFSKYSYIKNDRTSTTYTYDPAGRRISKTVNGVTTNHIWDDNGNIVYEYGTKGATTYNRGLGGEVITAGDNYYAYNGHGDTTNLLSKDKDSINVAFNATYAYDAFGNLTENTGGESDDNPFRYNGQYTDDETGFIYLRNRYYDPSIGRFTQEDTYWNVNNMIYGDKQYDEDDTKIPDYSAIAQSINLYVYCMNDPVNCVDPNGCDIISDIQRAYFMYGVTVNIARTIWTLGADFYLDRNKGWYLTATLLKLSVNGESNQSFVANGGDYAAETVRNDRGFNNQINNDIWSYASVGYTSVDFWGSYAFNLNGDLGAALHNVSYHVKGNKNLEGRWDVYVSVYDTFDFTEFVIPIGGEYTAQETFLWIVNDAGAISQAVRIIKPVSVEINYRQTF